MHTPTHSHLLSELKTTHKRQTHRYSHTRQLEKIFDKIEKKIIKDSPRPIPAQLIHLFPLHVYTHSFHFISMQYRWTDGNDNFQKSKAFVYLKCVRTTSEHETWLLRRRNIRGFRSEGVYEGILSTNSTLHLYVLDRKGRSIGNEQKNRIENIDFWQY